MLRRQRRWLLVIFLIAPLALAIRTPLLRLAGHALAAEDPLAPSDVVVVPQWASDAGALEAVDLVRRGYAQRVAVLLVPDDAAEAELRRRGIHVDDFHNWLTHVIATLGVPVQNIPNTASGTEAESDLLPAWCTRNGIQSIIVVSTADHSRRVRRVLRRTMAGRGIRVIVREAGYSQFDPDAWWKSRGGARTEVVEFEKLALDVMRHPFD
jgi:hypothetical protein